MVVAEAFSEVVFVYEGLYEHEQRAPRAPHPSKWYAVYMVGQFSMLQSEPRYPIGYQLAS